MGYSEMTSRRAWTWVVLLVGGCATISQRVDPTELAALTPEQRAKVEPAEATLKAAMAERDERRDEDQSAKRRVEIAEAVIQREEADLRVAELKFDAAEDTRDADAMLPARQRRDRAKAALARAQAEHVVRVAEEEVWRAQVKQAEARVEAAEAALEVARLEAVLRAKEKLTPEDEKRRAEFNEQAASAEINLAVAKKKTQEAQQRLKEVRSASAADAPEAAPTEGAGPNADDTSSTRKPAEETVAPAPKAVPGSPGDRGS
jgi:hypothetical protein